MKKLVLPFLLVAFMSGCTLISKLEPGNVTVGGKLTVKIDRAWNELSEGIRESSAHWTRDGLPLDNLQFFVGISDDARIGRAQGKDVKPLIFKASMQGDQLVGLIENFYSRDGSRFALTKVEPTTFGGVAGVKVRFTLVRKEDDVKLTGIAWVVNHNKEFSAMLYTAPSLGIFPKNEAMIQAIAESAKFK